MNNSDNKKDFDNKNSLGTMDTAETVGVHLEDSEYGPTLAVDRTLDEGHQHGLLESLDRLATVVITAGSRRGTTFIWDPAEIGVSPIR